MAREIIGSIPEFTQEAPASGEIGQEVGAASAPEPVGEPATGEEKETPSEPPTEPKPAEEPETTATTGEDIGALKDELIAEVQGLKSARVELIEELRDLRGQRREAKQAELQKLDQEIDDLRDLNPQDVQLFDRILRAKGYASKGDVTTMLYKARKQDEVGKFLSEFPEYNETNDPDRKKFGPLLNEISLYKEPEDPLFYGVLLKRAHRALSGTRAGSDRGTTAAKRQLEIAGLGAGGTQRSSSVTSFDPKKKQRLLDGGWSEEDIKRMEQRET